MLLASYRVGLRNVLILIAFLPVQKMDFSEYKLIMCYSVYSDGVYCAAFGFCEYEDPEATLRCIRLLNEWLIADKKLVVSFVLL